MSERSEHEPAGSGWDDEDDRWPHEGEGSWRERYERGKAAGRPRSGWRLYARGADQAYEVLGYLLGGMVFWGGIGFLVDWLVGFHYLFTPIGLILGLAGGIYLAAAKGRGSPAKDRSSKPFSGPPAGPGRG